MMQMAWNYGTYFGGYQPGGLYGANAAQAYGQTPNPGQVNQPQQNGGGLIWVQGETGAKSFMVGPGQSVLLMDSEGSKFYIKSADVSGMPMPLRCFEFREITPESMAQGSHNSVVPTSDGVGEYVTRKELEARLAQIIGNTQNQSEVNANG
jgi:hypothetical protein